MKKNIVINILLILIILMSGCGKRKEYEYFGNYENDLVYQKIMEFENCTEPEQLAKMLENMYNESITYISMEYDEEKGKFCAPYDDFEFEVLSIYSPDKCKGNISSNSYAFFIGETEVPLFIMDDDGSYLVSNYEIAPSSNDYIHKVTAWVMSELYLCLHNYVDCDNDENLRMIYKNIVKSMNFYTDFETELSKN